MALIRGLHHLTMSVGPAQEDYDFHTGVLGLYNVKKTALYDGKVPIYHLYYANPRRRQHDPDDLPVSPGRRDGPPGGDQIKLLNLSVPADSIGFWADRLSANDITHETVQRFGPSGSTSRTRAASSTRSSVRPGRTRGSRGTATGSRRSMRSGADTASRSRSTTRKRLGSTSCAGWRGS